MTISEENMIVCRCEGVTYKELRDTAEKYKCSARELKLRTRAAMGYCGGRTCRSLVDKCAHKVTGGEQEEITLKYQPPVRPVYFGELGADQHD